MKKKVLSILIMVGMLSVPNIVQASENINVNKFCVQNGCKTSTVMYDEFLKFIYKNLEPQTKKYFCGGQEVVQSLCKYTLLNTEGNVRNLNCVNYMYNIINKEFEYKDNCSNSIKLIELQKSDILKEIPLDKDVKISNNDIKEETEVKIQEKTNTQVDQDVKLQEKVDTKVENKQEVKPNSEVKSIENKDEKLSSNYKNEVNKRMIQLVNELRQSQGVAPLKSVDILNNLAEKRSQYMAITGEFSHNDTNGNFIFKEDLDKINYKWNNVGENIAQNYYSNNPDKLAEELFNQWKNSQGHYKNMINSDFNELGFGIGMTQDGKVYATQGFVGRR
ncbi:CAP domain-containing protein [Clostridium botulinum]|uniref:N-acetylmuramoyl-L-alanine amidase n=1 Tax=Clostridium botulinum TaxID=1491 RepID=A0A9Q1UX83_CLOBO|nr:CAP domain-containing protein [Clostridium botulinum]AEB75949.1 putative S-layer protein/internalin A-like/N-acetylmuramoyl-L-alanine amidase [Clostridium botulinum BKT015925]KEI02131.1 N-acetylmuramoyl-L-alanine amidase [Clostridium botulinum C/D str. Sp77]KLU75720.1 N-acetylmuramoyl-L-alanine amidase [Clostridium botulinum V891]KOA74928.1 N-acetylmuramoyl-L-alanine amidase [Clostridium botulinum]KOA75155.1 N-acetylmuramoyl-L-alanine amidase [Clostridium botulinum]